MIRYIYKVVNNNMTSRKNKNKKTNKKVEKNMAKNNKNKVEEMEVKGGVVENQETEVKENEVTENEVAVTAETTTENQEQAENQTDDAEQAENQEPSNEEGSEDAGEPKAEDKPEPVKPEPVVRMTAIEKTQLPKTIKWIVKNKEKLNFALAIQRNSVWTSEQKSLFVHSLMYGYPFPPAFAQDNGDGILWLLDGKQRLTTVIEFCEDKFKLHKNTPNVFGHEVANKKFSQLHEDFQDEILSTNFTIHQMRGLTDSERDEMFVRLNKGTPLSKIEQTRAMYSSLIAQIEAIAGLEFFQDHVTIPTNRFADQELILQTAMILDEDHNLKGIGSVQIQKYVAELKLKGELLSDEIFNKFVKADDYLSMVAGDLGTAELKQILKKVNVPMVIVTALRAIEEDVPPTLFGEFLVNFLITNYKRDSDYGIACQAGSAKKENVLVRLQEMDNGYVEFVNKMLNLKGEKKIQSKAKELEEAI